MATIDVSIILAVYNGASTLPRAIDSVLSQTHSNWELIITNDASTDQTLDIIRTYQQQDSRIKLINLPENKGQSYARNQSISEAKGEWVTILDDDDAYTPDRLETLLRFAQAHSLDMAADNVTLFDANCQQAVHDGIPATQNDTITWNLPIQILNDRLHLDFKWGLVKPFIRRDFLLESHVKYHENFRMAEDSLFVMELLKHNAHAAICPQAMYIYSTSIGLISGQNSGQSTSHYRTEDHLATLHYFEDSYARELSFSEKKALKSLKNNIAAYDYYMELKSYISQKNAIKAFIQLAAHPATLHFLLRALRKQRRRKQLSRTLVLN